jgi:uncharacterized protein (UPF0548 family)
VSPVGRSRRLGDDAEVSVEILSSTRSAALRAAPFSYDAVGATAAESPVGFSFFTRTRVLIHSDFGRAAQDLMGWRMHQRAGLRVRASSPLVAADVVVLLSLGWRRASVRFPCRVVYVVDEPDARGFAYGTLPGHPERGEERFVVSRRTDGRLEFTISAFSRPATRMAKLGGPLSPVVQSIFTNRYLAALDQ